MNTQRKVQIGSLGEINFHLPNLRVTENERDFVKLIDEIKVS